MYIMVTYIMGQKSFPISNIFYLNGQRGLWKVIPNWEVYWLAWPYLQYNAANPCSFWSKIGEGKTFAHDCMYGHVHVTRMLD